MGGPADTQSAIYALQSGNLVNHRVSRSRKPHAGIERIAMACLGF